MLRLAVSDLDSWLLYTQPALEAFELSTEQLITRLLRKEEPSEEMLCGSAFHGVMERLSQGELQEVEQDGWKFYFEIDSELALPQARESFIERIYQTNAGPVLLRGRIDARDGDLVTDYKLTLGSFDGERYADSMQWRAYLDITGAAGFRHLVFEGNRPGKRGNEVWIYDVHDFRQWAYQGMHADVVRCVTELAEFVLTHVPEKAA